MTNFLKAALIISFLIAGTAIAQVTIGTGDLPIDHGTTILRATTADLYTTVDIGPSGPNQTWDFTGMTTTETWRENWVDPTTMAGAANFPDATEAFYWDSMPNLVYFAATTTIIHTAKISNYPF